MGAEKIAEPAQPITSSGLSSGGRMSRRVAVVFIEKRKKKIIGKTAPGTNAIKTDLPKSRNRVIQTSKRLLFVQNEDCIHLFAPNQVLYDPMPHDAPIWRC
jgi:hypothetical protein